MFVGMCGKAMNKDTYMQVQRGERKQNVFVHVFLLKNYAQVQCEA
jgi:hypothetical protein